MTRLPSVLERLRREPGRFGFDAAIRVLMRARRTADPAQAARFRESLGLSFPAAEITAVEQDGAGPPRVTTPLIGLTGATGVLPHLYGEVAARALRSGSTSLRDMLDLLAHRLVSRFAAAGIKYRLARATETAALQPAPAAGPIAGTLLALGGFGTLGLVERVACGPEPLLHYAGLFAMRPRSAERLAALVSDWLGRPVEVAQFAGGWLVLPPAERTALPRSRSDGWNRLGADAVIGVRSWDPQARVVLRIGPLDRTAFEALLPGQPAHLRLVALVRAFLGLETGFAVNPVLARDAAFPVTLGAGARLGWTSWINPPGRPSVADACDAVFEAT